MTAIVPSAGKGERFGSQKLLADVHGEPLLSRTIRSLLDAGLIHVVVVISDPSPIHPETVPVLADRRVSIVLNPDPSRGMFSSIQVGVRASPAADQLPFLILPGDMPFVRPETIAAVLHAAAWTHHVVSARHGGRRGHPIALPGSLRRAILDADPGDRLDAVIAAQSIGRVDVDVDDAGILRDVDVRADLASPPEPANP